MLKAFLIFWSLLVGVSSAQGAKKVIHMVTFSAPPFMSEDLPEQGAGVYAFREIFRKANYELKVTFAPYLRAKRLVLQEDRYAGFFPVSLFNHIPSELKMSKIIYQTPWVLAERKDKVINWQNPKDLVPFKIGTVTGYDIAPSFKDLYKSNKLKLEFTSSDELNLLKLATKRVDLIFIEAGMFQFLTKTSPKLKEYREALQINKKIVQMDRYGLAFKKSPQSLKYLETFNQIAQEEEFNNLIQTYFRRYAVPF
ncbi:MAG: transporter substrate-binding domain-containing protein [Bdellovibrio sp.]|nr:transporter substrate-binding domain-containing protein [Bdellovibrio sp.]